MPQFLHLSNVSKNSLLCLFHKGVRRMESGDTHTHIWMRIKYQINVKLTLFFLLNKVVSRRGVGMVAFSTEGLVTQ